MTTQANHYRADHRNFTPPGKKTAIVLGLLVGGYVAIAVANHALPRLNAIHALHPGSSRAMPAAEIAVPAPRPSINALSASDSRSGELKWENEPRECRADAGIVTECIFN